MATRKIAISVREDVLKAADRLAKKLGKSRSALISELLARAAKEQRDREITEALNRVHGKPAVRREQARLARETYVGEVFGDDSEW